VGDFRIEFGVAEANTLWVAHIGYGLELVNGWVAGVAAVVEPEAFILGEIVIKAGYREEVDESAGEGIDLFGGFGVGS